jgi:ribonuclease HI
LEKRERVNLAVHPASFDLKVHIDDGIQRAFDGLLYYTDGSKCDKGTGAGFAVINEGRVLRTKKLKMAHYCSVFQAELIAIKEALEDVTRTKDHVATVNVFTDSQASLVTIRDQNTNNKIAKNIQELATKIKETKGVQINFNWLKGHNENTGNELADLLAKEASVSKTRIHYDNVPISFIKLHLTKEASLHSRNLLGRGLSVQTKQWLHEANDMALEAVLTYPRISSFITGHGPFRAHLNKIFGSLTPICDLCNLNEPQTSDHVLWDCQFFNETRSEIPGQLSAPTRAKDLLKCILESSVSPYVTRSLDKIYIALIKRNKPVA